MRQMNLGTVVVGWHNVYFGCSSSWVHSGQHYACCYSPLVSHWPSGDSYTHEHPAIVLLPPGSATCYCCLLLPHAALLCGPTAYPFVISVPSTGRAGRRRSRGAVVFSVARHTVTYYSLWGRISDTNNQSPGVKRPYCAAEALNMMKSGP